jgi:3'(2'), 5'-bisphosphate nucleotidase
MLIDKAFCEGVWEILQEAGAAIADIYKSRDLNIEIKNDDSPVTRADYLSHTLITERLRNWLPGSYIISEEGIVGSPKKTYWLLDPLDGTREFISGSDDFVISLAYVIDHKIKAGFLFHPLTKEFWYATSDMGAFKKTSKGQDQLLKVLPLDTRRQTRCLLSRTDTPKLDRRLPELFPDLKTLRVGSALKFAYLAEAKADFYLRFKPSFEWDTAAGQIIVEQAGGLLRGYDQNEIVYGKADLLNPPLIAYAYEECYQTLIENLIKKNKF